ncbi:MAG: type II toxin-antitoxin system VapC family toxin [Ignavibacteria bacterium]|nr:type II toxin-antitoxin system VapC family toxin [Ignavibacteria bacterium]
MNGNRVVSDTNVLIYLLKGDEKAAKILNGKEVYVSIITEIELLGFRNSTAAEISKIKNLLSDCYIVDLNNIVKEQAIEMKRFYNLKTPDAIVCATSKFLNIPLVSSDKKLTMVGEINVVFFD